MKAYRDVNGRVLLFRPKDHLACLNRPANRLLPDASSNNDADYFFDNLSITPAVVLDQALVHLTGKLADGTPVLYYHTPVAEPMGRARLGAKA
jgi:hypothetical protein